MIHKEKSSCELLKHVALSVPDLISKALVYSGMNLRITSELLSGCYLGKQTGPSSALDKYAHFSPRFIWQVFSTLRWDTFVQSMFQVAFVKIRGL